MFTHTGYSALTHTSGTKCDQRSGPFLALVCIIQNSDRSWPHGMVDWRITSVDQCVE